MQTRSSAATGAQHPGHTASLGELCSGGARLSSVCSPITSVSARETDAVLYRAAWPTMKPTQIPRPFLLPFPAFIPYLTPASRPAPKSDPCEWNRVWGMSNPIFITATRRNGKITQTAGRDFQRRPGIWRQRHTESESSSDARYGSRYGGKHFVDVYIKRKNK